MDEWKGGTLPSLPIRRCRLFFLDSHSQTILTFMGECNKSNVSISIVLLVNLVEAALLLEMLLF
jgi:hypothetical protein